MRLRMEYANRKDNSTFFIDVFAPGIKMPPNVYADYTWEEFLAYKDEERKKGIAHKQLLDNMKDELLHSDEYEPVVIEDIRIGFKCQILDYYKAVWVDKEVTDFERHSHCATNFDDILDAIDNKEARKLKAK